MIVLLHLRFTKILEQSHFAISISSLWFLLAQSPPRSQL